MADKSYMVCTRCKLFKANEDNKVNCTTSKLLCGEPEELELPTLVVHSVHLYLCTHGLGSDTHLLGRQVFLVTFTLPLSISHKVIFGSGKTSPQQLSGSIPKVNGLHSWQRVGKEVTSMMIIIVGASLSEQHTDLHTAGFVTRMHK